MIDQQIEARLVANEVGEIERLEELWKANKLDSAWYTLTLALGLSSYPLHDQPASMLVVQTLYESRYRVQAAVLGSLNYLYHPEDTSFVAILESSDAPSAQYGLATYYNMQLQRDAEKIVYYARRSLRYKYIPHALEMLITYDNSISNEYKSSLIEIWDQHVSSEEATYIDNLLPSVKLYHEYWFYFILGTYKYPALKESTLLELRQQVSS